MVSFAVHEVQFEPGDAEARAEGIEGCCSFWYAGELVMVIVGRSLTGRAHIQFPVDYFTPSERDGRINYHERKSIEREVLAAIGLDGGAP